MPEVFLLNLHNICAGAWRRRYLMATCMLLLPMLGLLVGLLSPRNWETHTSVLVQETAKLNPFLEDLSVSTNVEGRYAALQALLHSRYVLSAVAEELQLVAADSDAKEREQVIAELSANLSLQLLGKDLLQLNYKSRNPQNMAKTLTVVRERFLQQLLAPQQSSVTSSEAFLKQQLSERQSDLQSTERQLADYKQLHAAELPGLLGSNMTSLRKLKETVGRKRTELAGAKAAQVSQEARLAQVNPVIGRLEEQIVSITSGLALLRARYTDEHSEVLAAQRQLHRLEEERGVQLQQAKGLAGRDLEQLWRLAAGSESADPKDHRTLLISQLEALQIANNRVVQLQNELADQDRLLRETESQVSSYGEVERGMAELERNLVARRELYQDLQLRFEKARVTGALGRFEEPERIKVIDEALQPLQPTNLPLGLFVLAGVLAGALLGAGLALVCELTDTTIRRRDRLELLLEVPVITRMPCVTQEQAG